MENEFNYNLAFAAIVKNESPYIDEWISFHKSVGVEKFYIYDNESTDDLKNVLQPYIDEGLIEYTYFPGKAVQILAYKDAVKKHKEEVKYLGFIDIDEFVVPVNNPSILNMLNEIMPLDSNAAGVAINWKIYGSSGFMEKQDGLIIENYRYRADDNFENNKYIKTICNPRLIEDIKNVYSPIYINNMYNIDESGNKVTGKTNSKCPCLKLRINHYFTKSMEEYIIKMNKGKADSLDKRTLDDFNSNNKNDIYDYNLEQYANLLK
ncbi:MAG: glycosyltransferase family 92 protein [Clostridia bacterium]|nr:glycosyltransferase family 92 protein [Clostridia bacterium]